MIFLGKKGNNRSLRVVFRKTSGIGLGFVQKISYNILTWV